MIPNVMIDSFVEDFSASSPEKACKVPMYLWRWRYERHVSATKPRLEAAASRREFQTHPGL